MAKKQIKKVEENEELLEKETLEDEEVLVDSEEVEEENIDDSLKEEKKTKKERKSKKEKNNKKQQKDGFAKELKKVVWPKGSEVFKSTIAVIVICLLLIGFFELTQLLVAFVKGLFV